LRLPGSIREEAQRAARLEGVSLNQFISIALSEKLTRLRMASAAKAKGVPAAGESRLPNQP
jgi:uncharacterized membrane protein